MSQFSTGTPGQTLSGTSANFTGSSRFPANWRVGLLAGILLAWGAVAAIEFGHFGSATPAGTGPRWLRDLDLSLADTQLWFWCLPVLAGAVLWPSRIVASRSPAETTATVPCTESYHPVSMSMLLVAAVAGLAHWGLLVWVYSAMGGATPAYHDETSYLLQSQTLTEYVTGETDGLPGASLWTRGSAKPEPLFDQMHVWNRGVRASRYFPGMGLWLAAWGGTTDEAAVAAIQIAGCLSVSCWTLVAGRLGGISAASMAGLCLSAASGLLLFHNLILAHAPTELGLGVLFLAWTFQPPYGLIERPGWQDGWGWALVSGAGLTGAMLCRPLTAAGVALPLGLLWLTRCFHSRCRVHGCSPERRLAMAGTFGLGLPLLAGFAVMAHQNHAITGAYASTAYSAYTERFTPRHVYGFNNRVRGEQKLGPEILEHYDEWAENLTLSLAFQNLGRRLVSAWRYTLGLVPALIVCGCIAGTYRMLTTHSRALLGGILGLFAVYFPYWFDGIMHWHYVYESAPLWIVLAAVSLSVIARQAWSSHKKLVVVMGILLVAMSALDQVAPLAGLGPTRLAVGVSELRFSKTKYKAMDAILREQVRQRPAVVAVIADPDDRHIDFVSNPARLDGEVIRVRYLSEQYPLIQFAKWFPGRSVYTVDAKTGTVRHVAKPSARGK